MSGLHCETNLIMSATNATTLDELLAQGRISFMTVFVGYRRASTE